jgi:hypothetical protein
MSSEGNLWKARWNRSGRNYRAFLADDPNLQATGKTIDDAIERLEERVIEERGDVVPHFEWLNPLPYPSGVEGRDFVSVLCGHRRVDVENVERLLANPRCARCQNYAGSRTIEPIRLNVLPDGDLPFTQFGGQLCSAQLAYFLKLNEREDVKLLPVVIAGKETNEFFELRSTKARDYVAKMGTPCRNAFHCPACGLTVITYYPEEADYFQFVAAASLPNPLPPVWAIGSQHLVRLGVSKLIRQQVVRSREFKNIATRKIGILGADLAISAGEFFRTGSK